MQITTVNVNGIRAAVKQRSETNLGFIHWLRHSDSDIVLLQEVRASEKDTEIALAPVLDDGWFYIGAPAAAKGRAGVGILSRSPLSDIRIGIPGFEDSGRYIQGSFDDNGTEVVVASLYLPSGSANTAKQDEKYYFLDSFEPFLAQAAQDNEYMVVGGDWNICHREQDLKNFKTNRKKSGFLPDERAFMDALFGTFPDEHSQIDQHGQWAGTVEYVPAFDQPRQATRNPHWFDVARRLHPQDAPYTWWTYRGQAFDTNAGWRIDYQAATAKMLARAEKTWVDKASAYDLRWSDHSPLNVMYR
ncbi:endonuclease/exonuclease/phosphatase family protein [Corynebacterium kutscheri]|uniref:Endonuclease/exonuclease/phosphatase family protein n=1 Tax=Corynebacterium kutscheri TaxID=35755 RepID=A0A0F6QYM3_9CORY|nr:exodeoxyribonuclease III [Corynebacterium kutscheri]AKE40662.1 exodeoxyribonuclease III Xth [Corynebacterium kutscheri]VEH04755.1 endonuclease/exonuclease/phosphatase family protein [Corynebacterium kutscheri]VEH11059.1 endonuclease/exonuclease/phosphatase family protein [Corynebacterium kutscheri]VEH80463.1 endonuclease/exonuclease/phosphatase family protein [Corynebacterium kutscheri]